MPQTAPPTIAALPDAPQTSDGRLVFPGKADAFVAALAAFRTQANALGSNVYANAGDAYAQAVAAAQQASASAASATLAQSQVALASAQATAAAASAASALAAPATSATSATSMTPGTGTRSFTTQSGKAFVAGQGLTITSAADPRQWMVGTVSSYSGTALSVNVTAFGQASTGGAAADWVIAFWGAVPAAAKPGQVLRLRGSTPEWGDEGGEPIVIRSALNLHPQSTEILSPANGGTALNAAAIGPRGGRTASIFTSGAAASWSVVSVLGFTAGQRVTYERSARAVSGNTVIRINVYFVGDLTDAWADVDLSTGQVIDLQSNNTRGVRPTVLVTPEGNGWYRIALILTAHVAGHIGFYVTIFPNSTYHVAEASVTVGAAPALYVDVPSTTPVAGAGARRRNILSNHVACDIDEGSWAQFSMTRVGRAVSPIGDLNATVYEYGHIDAYLGQGLVPLTPGEQWTFSFWYRLVSGSASSVTMRLFSDGVGITRDFVAPIDQQWRRMSGSLEVGAAGDLYVLLPFPRSVGSRIAYWMGQCVRGPQAVNPIMTTSLDAQHADLQLRRVHHVDSTHAPVILAPPLMQPGDWFEVVDIGGNAAINNITVMRGPYSAIAGDATDFEIDVPRWSGRFTFDPEKGLVIQ